MQWSVMAAATCKTKLIGTKISKSTLSFMKFSKMRETRLTCNFTTFFSGGGTLRDRLDDLNTKLGQVTTLVTESDTQIENAKMKSEKATQKVVNAKEIIDQARESLRVIYFFLYCLLGYGVSNLSRLWVATQVCVRLY